MYEEDDWAELEASLPMWVWYEAGFSQWYI